MKEEKKWPIQEVVKEYEVETEKFENVDENDEEEWNDAEYKRILK